MPSGTERDLEGVQIVTKGALEDTRHCADEILGREAELLGKSGRSVSDERSDGGLQETVLATKLGTDHSRTKGKKLDEPGRACAPCRARRGSACRRPSSSGRIGTCRRYLPRRYLQREILQHSSDVLRATVDSGTYHRRSCFRSQRDNHR